MNSFIDWFSFFNDRKQQRKNIIIHTNYFVFRVVRHTIETTVLLRHREVVPMNVARHWIISKLSHFSVCFVVDFNSMSGGHLQRKQYYIFFHLNKCAPVDFDLCQVLCEKRERIASDYIFRIPNEEKVCSRKSVVYTLKIFSTQTRRAQQWMNTKKKKSIRNATTYVVAYVQVCWFAARRLQYCFFYSFLSVSLYQQQYVFTPAVGTYGHINALFFPSSSSSSSSFLFNGWMKAPNEN